MRDCRFPYGNARTVGELVARVVYALFAALVIYWVWSIQQRKLKREAQYAQRLQVEVRDRTLELRRSQSGARKSQPAAQGKPVSPTRSRGSATGAICRQMLTQFVSAPAPPGAKRDAATPRMVFDGGRPRLPETHQRPATATRAGDRILTQVADILRDCCRTGDYAVRWGGDEFVVAYLQADLSHAEGLAERVPLACRQTDLSPGRWPSCQNQLLDRVLPRANRCRARGNRRCCPGSSA